MPPAAHPARRGVLLAACALVVVPVVAAVVRQAADGWRPDGDDAWMARRTMQVFTAHPPLVGQESTASDVPTTDGLSHPGPAAYYVMAVPYALTGWSPVGLLVGAGLIVAGAAAVVVLLAARVGGERAALGTAAGLALLATHLGMLWLVHPASSVLVVLPLLAAVVGVWAYAWGDRAGLVAAVGFGSFALQTSLVVLPVAAAVLLATVVVASVRWVRLGERPVAGRGWWLVGAVGLTWLPPLVDQVTRRPGNLSNLADYLWSEAAGRPRDGKAATALGLKPALGTVLDVVTNPFGAGGRALRPEGVEVITPGHLVKGPLLLFVLLLAACGAWWWRHRDRVAASLAGTAAVLTAVAVVALSRRPNGVGLTPSYYVLWVDGVAVLWWAAFATTALDAAQAWAARARALDGPAVRAAVHDVGFGVVAGLVLYAVVGPRTDATSARVRSLSEQIRSRVPAQTVAIRPRGLGPAFTAKGVGADLVAHGYDARFDEWGGMVDERSRAMHRGQASLVFLEGTEAARRDDVPGRVARFGSGSEATAVWFVPGGPYSRFCLTVLSLRVAPSDGSPVDVPRFATSTAGWSSADRRLARRLDAGGAAARGLLANGGDPPPGPVWAAAAHDEERMADVRAALALFDRRCVAPGQP